MNLLWLTMPQASPGSDTRRSGRRSFDLSDLPDAVDLREALLRDLKPECVFHPRHLRSLRLDLACGPELGHISATHPEWLALVRDDPSARGLDHHIAGRVPIGSEPLRPDRKRQVPVLTEEDASFADDDRGSGQGVHVHVWRARIDCYEDAAQTSPDGRDAAHRRGVVDMHSDREASGDPDHGGDQGREDHDESPVDLVTSAAHARIMTQPLDPAVQPVVRRIVCSRWRAVIRDERLEPNGSMDMAEPAAREMTRSGPSIWTGTRPSSDLGEAVRSLADVALDSSRGWIDVDPSVESMAADGVERELPCLLHVQGSEPVPRAEPQVHRRRGQPRDDLADVEVRGAVVRVRSHPERPCLSGASSHDADEHSDTQG